MSADSYDENTPIQQLTHFSEYADQKYGENIFGLEDSEADENIRYAGIIKELTEFENAHPLSEVEPRRLNE